MFKGQAVVGRNERLFIIILGWKFNIDFFFRALFFFFWIPTEFGACICEGIVHMAGDVCLRTLIHMYSTSSKKKKLHHRISVIGESNLLNIEDSLRKKRRQQDDTANAWT